MHVTGLKQTITRLAPLERSNALHRLGSAPRPLSALNRGTGAASGLHTATQAYLREWLRSGCTCLRENVSSFSRCRRNEKSKGNISSRAGRYRHLSERYVMRNFAFVFATAALLVIPTSSVFSQSIQVGPGGVHVDDGRGRGGGQCEELRRCL